MIDFEVWDDKTDTSFSQSRKGLLRWVNVPKVCNMITDAWLMAIIGKKYTRSGVAHILWFSLGEAKFPVI